MTKLVLYKNIISKGSRSGLDIIDKIFLIPIFLSYWDSAQYADWLLLLSIIAIFSFPEIGINQYIANRIGLCYDLPKEVARLTRLASSAIILVQIILITITVACILIFGSPEFGFRHYPRAELLCLLFAFWLNALILQLGNTYVAFYKAENALFIATRQDTVVRVAEISIIFLYVVFSIHELSFLFLFILPRATIYLLRRRSFKLSRVTISTQELKAVLRDSTKYSVFNITPILQHVLMSSSIARLFGDVQLVIFVTAKSIYGTIRLLAAIIYGSFWPFFTNSLRLGKVNDFLSQTKSMILSIALIISVAAPLLYFTSPLVYAVLDAKAVMVLDISLFVIISSSCLALSNSLASILLSVNLYNSVIKYSIAYLVGVGVLSLIGTLSLLSFVRCICFAEFLFLVAVATETHQFRRSLRHE